MTTVQVKRLQDGLIVGLIVNGHSGYAKSGSDIVCSSISTALNMTISIIEKLGIKYEYKIQTKMPEIIFSLKEPNQYSQIVLNSFIENIEALVKEYKEYVKVI